MHVSVCACKDVYIHTYVCVRVCSKTYLLFFITKRPDFCAVTPRLALSHISFPVRNTKEKASATSTPV